MSHTRPLVPTVPGSGVLLSAASATPLARRVTVATATKVRNAFLIAFPYLSQAENEAPALLHTFRSVHYHYRNRTVSFGTYALPHREYGVSVDRGSKPVLESGRKYVILSSVS